MPSSFVVPEVDDSARVVHEELGRLPARFQGVAVLCDLEGKTYAEAAQLLGCPIGTVMSRLSEARRRLRRGLARRGLAPAAGRDRDRVGRRGRGDNPSAAASPGGGDGPGRDARRGCQAAMRGDSFPRQSLP